MLFNELAQWAFLVFLAVFVFGLTRQLGVFLVPQKQQLLDAAPSVGKRVPAALLEDGRGDDLMRLAHSSAAEAAGLFVLEDDCPACNALLSYMEAENVTVDMPVVALLKGDAGSEFGRRVKRAFADVIEDDSGDLANRAEIGGTPFLLIFDEQLIVRHTDWGGDLFGSVSKWLAANRPHTNGAATLALDERSPVSPVHR